MKTANRDQELTDKLTDGIANLVSSDEWQRHLDIQSRFHKYSFGNVMLIGAQSHEASRVAGFNAWKKFDRAVRKGERAIYILAPMVYRNTDESIDSSQDNRVIRGFKYVSVFDVSQTDGKDLPTVCHKISGDDPAGCYDELVQVAQSIGFIVQDHDFDGGTNGDCNHTDNRIRIRTDNSPAQRVKTLAHEIAHALLHEKFKSRALAELEAESTAYIVCQVLGIDSGDYSFGYVATWAGGGDEAIAGIRSSGERIQKSAAKMLEAFEPAAEEAPKNDADTKDEDRHGDTEQRLAG